MYISIVRKSRGPRRRSRYFQNKINICFKFQVFIRSPKCCKAMRIVLHSYTGNQYIYNISVGLISFVPFAEIFYGILGISIIYILALLYTHTKAENIILSRTQDRNICKTNIYAQGRESMYFAPRRRRYSVFYVN